MDLIVGNLSSWSMRAWLVLKIAEVTFNTKPITLGQSDTSNKLAPLSVTKLVPILHHKELQIHDSLAIAEYINELYPHAQLLPVSKNQRAIARSLCAELHSGFSAIRTELPLSFEIQDADKLSSSVKKELLRLDAIFQAAAGQHYFERPGTVDAFYAIMALRLRNYNIHLSDRAERYAHHLINWPMMQALMEEFKS